MYGRCCLDAICQVMSCRCRAGVISMRHARRYDVVPVMSCRLYWRCRAGVSYGCFMQAFDLLGVRVSGVRLSRGEGVAGAVATDIAIGSLASEKIPKGETPPSEKMAKWGLDKSPQNDKTRA